MKKRLLTVLIICVAIISIFSVSLANNYDYNDLTWTTKDNYGRVTTHTHPAVREIKQASRIGIMNGYPDGTFKPNDTITRGEFIKILISLATNKTFDFNNVESNYSEWYGSYVTIAEMQGVIEKNQYTDIELENPITRIEMIFMLANVQIKMKNIPLTKVEDKLMYTDIGYLTEDERRLVLHAAQYDLIEGMKEGTDELLHPDQNITRGEAAMAFMRVY